jgi:2-keto-4-pentenoate hydratase
MSEPFDPAPAASLLAAHWRNGTQLTELPPEMRPRTLHEGYDVQDRLIAQMGEEVSGWKLGVGSPLAMRKGGLDRPLVGRILASRCYRSGDTVRLANQAPVTVEFEIAFILGRDIQPDSPPVSPMDAVSTTHPARNASAAATCTNWPCHLSTDPEMCKVLRDRERARPGVRRLPHSGRRKNSGSKRR